MVPLNNQPAPHNIILGQWEATESEAANGITDGFGAISALLFGSEQCGMASHPIAKARTDIYLAIIDFLSADNQLEEGEVDGGKTWKAKDTIFSFEESSCANAKRAAFPDDGDYSSFPMFATPTVSKRAAFTADFAVADSTSDTCYVVNERTDYIVW